MLRICLRRSVDVLVLDDRTRCLDFLLRRLIKASNLLVLHLLLQALEDLLPIFTLGLHQPCGILDYDSLSSSCLHCKTLSQIALIFAACSSGQLRMLLISRCTSFSVARKTFVLILTSLSLSCTIDKASSASSSGNESSLPACTRAMLLYCISSRQPWAQELFAPLSVCASKMLRPFRC